MDSSFGTLDGDQTEEEAEPCDDKAEPHDGEAAADPRQKRALGCEENARIGHCGFFDLCCLRYRNVGPVTFRMMVPDVVRREEPCGGRRDPPSGAVSLGEVRPGRVGRRAR